MKSCLIPFCSLIGVALLADAAFSAEQLYPVPPAKMAEYNAKTGGLIPPPANAKKVVVLDARAADVPQLAGFVEAAESVVSISCLVKRQVLAAADDPQKVAFDAKRAGAGAVVLFYERAGAPTMSVFPEDAIALVNLAPLKCADANQFSRRFSKEFWRSLAFALGGYGAMTQMGTSLQPAFSPAELDAIRGFGLSPMQISAISSAKSRLGIFGNQPVPYSRACREGWAPAPTNDVQRALYNRFKTPTSRFKTDFGK